jgi:hypothetical protein
MEAVMQNQNIEERPMAKSGGNRKGNGEPASTKYLGWRIFCGALVVALGLAAVVLSLHLVLDNYDVQETSSAALVAAKGTTPTASDTASVSASSAVAVLTPVMAGIIGLAGLYFGISATASARGRQAAAEETKAEREN